LIKENEKETTSKTLMDMGIKKGYEIQHLGYFKKKLMSNSIS
jgi:hypothetical protein